MELRRRFAAGGTQCVEYVEQLTMLLFLKMADQLTEPPHSKPPIVPPKLGWKPFLKLDGAALETQYSESIEALALKPGMLGVIVKGARCETAEVVGVTAHEATSSEKG